MQPSTIPNTWRDDTPLAARTYSTAQVARILLVSPQTLRNAMCCRGEYAGIRPTKLPSRFLAWPADRVDALARGEA